MSLKVIYGIVASALLASCSTTPISTDAALPVPQERILQDGKKLIAPSSNAGTIIVKRDSGGFGSGCSTRIYIDGAPVADIDSSEKIAFYLPPGEYIVSAQPNGICPGILTETKATVKAGQQSMFRFGISSEGHGAIYPTAF